MSIPNYDQEIEKKYHQTKSGKEARKKGEQRFLRESNAIENIWDNKSLDQATIAWEYLKEQRKLTHQVILKTHKILMINQPIFGYERGYYRKRAVYIGGREAKPWYALRDLMTEWMKKANKSKTWKEIRQDHVVFERIHPFLDGNGREGRLLANWQRIKAGLPILIIYEAKKHNYYKWFH